MALSSDITLEDIRLVIREEVDASFDRKFQPAFDKAFDKAFGPAFDKAFDKAFLPAFEAAFEPHAAAIQEDFARVHARLDRLENNVSVLTADVKELKAEVKGHGRMLRQHSLEIMELKARTA